MADTAAKKKHGEPRPYHVGWAVKWLIEEQATGKADLRFEGENAVAPLITWATYFWTDGDKPRPDGYRWTTTDVVKDGIHLSATGRTRVACELLAFWRTDTFARTWFTGGVQETDSATATQHAMLVIEDVFQRRTDLNKLLPAGNYQLHFLNKDGQRIQMTIDVPDVVRLR